MRKIWKVFVVFILALVAIVFLCVFVFLPKASAGLDIEFEIPGTEEKIKPFIVFADEFMLEMLKRRTEISFFTGDYRINGYLGALPDQDTGQLRSAIGIFIGDQKNAVYKVWLDELYSEKQIKKKAKEAADEVFQRLKEKEEKRKNLIKIPV